MVRRVYWHSISWEEALKKLGSKLEGLSDIEARKRLKRFGPNKLPESEPYSGMKILLNQFKSPLVLILLVSSLVTLLLEEYTDAIIILAAVALNTVIGYIQEYKASQALSKLKKVLKVRAFVLRGGKKKIVPQEELVPGDVIILKPGNKVPADGRLIECKNLRINESPLTGEWSPAEKSTEALAKNIPFADRDNMVYMGTMVESGWGKAVVTETGMNTEIGKVAGMIREMDEEKTPYQKKLIAFNRIVGITITIICLCILIEGVMAGRPFLEMFTTSVAIAVAAIPEGLPVAMTVVLALGMQKILERKGLVRRLVSAETLGSTSIICTDKTATLTEGRMRVVGIYTAAGKLLNDGKRYSKKIDKKSKSSHVLALKICVLCSEAFIENPDEPLKRWIVRGSPTDKALLLAGIQAGISREELEEEQPTIERVSFDPTRKYSASLHEFSKTEDILYMLGAPELVLRLSKYVELDGKQKKMSAKILQELTEKYESLTSKGFRILGAAYKRVKKGLIKPGKVEEHLKDMVFVSFIALHDPLRPEAKDAIQTCQRAGMKIIIVTGDHRLTAKAIAEELGLRVKDKNILDGQELDAMSDEELEKRLEDIKIYARVDPRQKMRIVKAWQKRGEVVAMTGDGINDAPALKEADIGVALGSGTDVAKEVSDLVLLTNNFSVLVSAVEEGRAIIDNIRKVITYLLSSSFTEVILIGGSMMAGLPLPLLPPQILWVNIIEDGLPSIALAFEPKEKDLMERKPEGHKTPLLTKEMKVLIFIIGIITDILLLGLFLLLFNRSNYGITHIRSIVFAALAIDTVCVFSCKSLRKNIWKINPFSNKLLVISWLVCVVTLLSAVYIPPLQMLLKTEPLSLFDWELILGLGAVEVLLVEVTKWYFISKRKLQKHSTFPISIQTVRMKMSTPENS